jgi:hypothetical protein
MVGLIALTECGKRGPKKGRAMAIVGVAMGALEIAVVAGFVAYVLLA